MKLSTANKKKRNKNGRMQSLRFIAKTMRLQKHQQGIFYGSTNAPRKAPVAISYDSMLVVFSSLMGNPKPQGEGKKREWSFKTDSASKTTPLEDFTISLKPQSFSIEFEMTPKQAVFWRQALGLPDDTEEAELISAVQQQLQTWEKEYEQ